MVVAETRLGFLIGEVATVTELIKEDLVKSVWEYASNDRVDEDGCLAHDTACDIFISLMGTSH